VIEFADLEVSYRWIRGSKELLAGVELRDARIGSYDPFGCF